MPKVAYMDAALTVWQGKDALQFIDGLSTNKIVDMVKGELRRTVFTSSKAKIIDLATVFHMGEFLAVVTHKSKLEALLKHITPRILNQDVSIVDVTTRNTFGIEYACSNTNVGQYLSNHGETIGYVDEHYSIIVASLDTESTFTDDLEAFHEWRIENQIPWNGYEISDKYHPLSVGLSHLVHPKKGCYIGQEVLVRMVSRGRQGKKLVTVENGSVAEKSVTTPGKRQSLAIIRE
tara:strand:- start:243 stop:944 length:702 start_codon:yes stop_codon:yes gene_type:complete